MNWINEFVELNKQIHDRSSFDCGENELNGFIKSRAAKHMAAGVTRTMVRPANSPLPDGKYPICSFYSIAPSQIERQTLPAVLFKTLPHYPIPVFLIAQLAVQADIKGRGFGKITLIKALEHLWSVNAQMRAYAVVVDCLNREAQDFYTKFGFEMLTQINGTVRLFMPMRKVGQLFED